MTQLHLELHGATSYLNSPWAFGVNVSRASLLLRKDIQRHLLLGRDDLGFRHVRFHGVFDDDMKVLQPDGSYDFTQFEQAIDWLMEQGFAPFIGLSGVPAAMATEGTTLAAGVSECVELIKGLAHGTGTAVPEDVARWMDVAAAAGRTPSRQPKDLEKWADMARALAAFVDGRYGCDAQEWNFEIWREPDDPARWTGSREDFFRLYDLTAKGIKSVNAQLKVGGPAAADQAWVEAFVDHVAQPSEAFGLDMQRCDFVTVSGLRADGAPAEAKSLVDSITAIRQKVTTALGETTPLILSAWSVGSPSHGPEHDRCAAGAAVAATMASLADVVNGALYASMSDIDQPSAALRYEPFHGGPGLVTVNDIRKASFNVFKLLNEHIGYKSHWRWEAPTDGVSVLVSRDYHHVVRILASYDKPGATGPARFTLEGLPDSVQWGQVQVIRPAAGSPLETWLELGKPPFVNRYLLDDLESGSHPAGTEVNFKDFPPRLEPGMTLQLTIPVPDDVMNTD